MKLVTHNAITYEVDGEPMETCPPNTQVVLIWKDGSMATYTTNSDGSITSCLTPPIAWKPIVAPKVVEPVKRFTVYYNGKYGYAVWDNTMKTNCGLRIPTEKVAKEIAAIYERVYGVNRELLPIGLRP